MSSAGSTVHMVDSIVGGCAGCATLARLELDKRRLWTINNSYGQSTPPAISHFGARSEIRFVSLGHRFGSSRLARERRLGCMHGAAKPWRIGTTTQSSHDKADRLGMKG